MYLITFANGSTLLAKDIDSPMTKMVIKSITNSPVVKIEKVSA